MQKVCYYCAGAQSKKLSQEHLISRVAMKAAFGKPIRNLAWADLLGDKTLLDHEQTLKDICVKCNADLSPYDLAGGQFVRDIDRFYDATDQHILFSQEILGWLLKTHMNHIRLIRDKETGAIYPIDDRIKQALITRKSVMARLYQFFIEGWEGKDYFWNPGHPQRVSYFQYRSIRFRSQRILLSNFRIKAIDTVLLLPSDAKYDGFDKRVESVLSEIKREWNYTFQRVNTHRVIISGILKISRVLPFNRIQSFIHPK